MEAMDGSTKRQINSSADVKVTLTLLVVGLTPATNGPL